MLSDGAGVHESLGNDGENGVHMVGSLDVKNKLRIFDDVDPEAQRQTEDRTPQCCLNTPLPIKMSFELGDIPVGLPDVYSV